MSHDSCSIGESIQLSRIGTCLTMLSASCLLLAVIIAEPKAPSTREWGGLTESHFQESHFTINKDWPQHLLLYIYKEALQKGAWPINPWVGIEFVCHFFFKRIIQPMTWHFSFSAKRSERISGPSFCCVWRWLCTMIARSWCVCEMRVARKCRLLGPFWRLDDLIRLEFRMYQNSFQRGCLLRLLRSLEFQWQFEIQKLLANASRTTVTDVFDTSKKHLIPCLAISFWESVRQGVCDGIINGPLIALMDDSCPAGRRSDVESMNASVGGPGRARAQKWMKSCVLQGAAAICKTVLVAFWDSPSSRILMCL